MIRSILFGFIFILLAGLAGCSGTPEQQFQQTENVLVSFMGILCLVLLSFIAAIVIAIILKAAQKE